MGKPVITTLGNRSYAVKLDTLSQYDYFNLPFGRQIDDLRKIGEFKATAKTTHVGAKHSKSTLAAVKKWVRERKPTQFYASWPADSKLYRDDSVQIWFIAPDLPTVDELGHH